MTAAGTGATLPLGAGRLPLGAGCAVSRTVPA